MLRGAERRDTVRGHLVCEEMSDKPSLEQLTGEIFGEPAWIDKRDYLVRATIAMFRGGICNGNTGGQYAVTLAETAWDEIEKRCPRPAKKPPGSKA